MKPGLNPYQVAPDAMKPVAALDKKITNELVDPSRKRSW
jgi:hypothetical protein